MKKLVFTVLLLVFGLTFASAQKKGYQQDPAKMTQEQRMVQSNAKHKNGRSADVSKKVKRAKKQDRAARKMKPPKTKKRKSPKH
jgi:Ni/Co efflux regulator RcnB